MYKFDVLIKDDQWGNMRFEVCADTARDFVQSLDNIQRIINAHDFDETRIVPWLTETRVMSQAELDAVCEEVERGPMCNRCRRVSVPYEGEICDECFSDFCHGRASEDDRIAWREGKGHFAIVGEPGEVRDMPSAYPVINLDDVRIDKKGAKNDE